ncbi:hypothetical protein LXH09_37255 [Streptomyces sp. CS7]|uniref:hypothetical protein n=1 Tax=Streptomyces sp. CS-7 TaxID=2906769 RepID=UPI0021B32AA6|nr:hypothetical protein [Streptomyces sp. CS-7]MCT6782273.1 hypothetical protein [Streptomyces sp. CS-7]
MTSLLRTRTAALLQAAGDLEDAVRRTGGWTTEAADETLDAVDVALTALQRLGPEARDVLVPAQDSLNGLQCLLLRQQQALEAGPAVPPARRVPRGA